MDLRVITIYKPIFVFIIIWIFAIVILTLIVNFVLAYKTRNPRYIFQFVGAVLFLFYLMFFLGMALYFILFSMDNDFGLASNFFVYDLIGIIFPIGALLLILGYYGPYHGKALRYSRNIVIKEGKRIIEMTNGYSNRPFSKTFDEINQLNDEHFAEISKKFAKNLAYRGLILDWRFHDNKLEIIPMNQLISDPDFFITNFKQVLNLFLIRRGKSKIVIQKNGSVIAVISEADYNEIKAPVAYHSLCNNVIDIFGRAFIEFSKSNYYGFDNVFIYGSNVNLDKPGNFVFPKFLNWDKADKNSALWFTAFFVAGPITQMVLTDIMRFALEDYGFGGEADYFLPANAILVIAMVSFIVFMERRIRRVKFF
jgi:hypothetical protein